MRATFNLWALTLALLAALASYCWCTGRGADLELSRGLPGRAPFQCQAESHEPCSKYTALVGRLRTTWDPAGAPDYDRSIHMPFTYLPLLTLQWGAVGAFRQRYLFFSVDMWTLAFVLWLLAGHAFIKRTWGARGRRQRHFQRGAQGIGPVEPVGPASPAPHNRHTRGPRGWLWMSLAILSFLMAATASRCACVGISGSVTLGLSGSGGVDYRYVENDYFQSNADSRFHIGLRVPWKPSSPAFAHFALLPGVTLEWVGDSIHEFQAVGADLSAWLLAPIFWLGAFGSFWNHRRSKRAQCGKACPQCGYDLRAHKIGDNCPECGTVIPPPPKPPAKQ